MRVWLDPDKISSRGLTVAEVVASLREQNVQVAAGSLGRPPVPNGQAFQYTLSTQGRLTTEAQFSEIIVKTGVNGELVRLRDLSPQNDLMNQVVDWAGFSWVPRTKTRSVISTVSHRSADHLPVAGSNALATADAIETRMQELRPAFPAELSMELSTTPRRLLTSPFMKCSRRCAMPSFWSVLWYWCFCSPGEPR